MGLHKTSIFSIFIFIKDNDLKFCTRSYSSCVYHMMRFKGSNGKVCKMMTSRFKTLCQDSEETKTKFLAKMEKTIANVSYSEDNIHLFLLSHLHLFGWLVKTR